jgi:hypothetical protein
MKTVPSFPRTTILLAVLAVAATLIPPRVRTDASAAACSSCDARHQNLARLRSGTGPEITP